MTQAHVFISGMVQGVGFRKHVQYHARKNGVYGWVKNIPDGRVEAVLQGSRQQIGRMLRACNRGSLFSDVKNVVVQWETQETMHPDFHIIRR